MRPVESVNVLKPSSESRSINFVIVLKSTRIILLRATTRQLYKVMRKKLIKGVDMIS